MSEKISVTPELLARFAAYNKIHGAWGSLHIVLDDNNYEDSSVEFCMEYAKEKQDQEGFELAKILLKCSKTQRNKISRMA